jgi:hypothetical protein
MRQKLVFVMAFAVMSSSCVESGAKKGANAMTDSSVSVVKAPSTEGSNSFYISNRPPLLPSPFIKLPIRSINPEGWLGRQLGLQAEGFHGHLTEISDFLKKEDNAWLSPEGVGSRGWEEVPYWLKGFSNTAYILGDERMLAEAKIWIEGALNSRKPDGWFGPDEGRSGIATGLKGRSDLWPNMIMLFCLQDYYDYSGDERVIELMTDYMRYLSEVRNEDFLVGYWPKMRAADLLFSIHWLYNRTGQTWLLSLGNKVHRHTADWTSDIINFHNVNIAQAFGGPTTYWVQSKDQKHLEASERNWRKIRSMYGQVPGGMFGGDENCRPGYTGPRQGVETCGMVEAMLSDETLLTITGNSIWADRCEDVAFNSLTAAFTADMKGLRYLTAPNMVVSDGKDKSPGLQNGGPMLQYNPHIHRCCQHNAGHGWPYYTEHLWLATPDNGLAAVLYCASQVTAKVGDGTEVVIEENTKYPFDEKIELVVNTPKAVEFPLYLRVPQWCEAPKLAINGQAFRVKAQSESYIVVSRKWRSGDKVALVLPMEVKLRNWTENKGSVSVDRGPLTYSLKIDEKYVRKGGTDKWPAWEVYPSSSWNYGLVLDDRNPASGFEVVSKPWPADNQPFEADSAPIELRAKARKIPNWTVDHLGLVGSMQQSPIVSAEPVETVTLIPMGAARLRISAFPTIGKGPDAHEWTPEPPPLKGMASHCNDSDSVDAVRDGKIPANSNDHSIPRFTWWPREGSTEWIQYKVGEKAAKVSSVEVYWFDDTGVGQCRVPESWKLLYKDGDKFKEVPNATGYGVEKDTFNKVSFDPVETAMLRIEAKLQDEVSGGILEWRVKRAD